MEDSIELRFYGYDAILIHLPDPVIQPPVLYLNSARIFNMNQRYVTVSKKSHETVVRNVQYSLIRAKEDILSRAAANGIREEARRLGEGYFRSLFAGVGFEIECIKVDQVKNHAR